jgi:hypothetical protein
METAKVDIRKLQVLNDCINRTIEALNQVRLSVHSGGLAHSAQMGLQGVETPAFFGGGFNSNYPGAFASPFGWQQTAGVVPGFANANLGGLTGGFPNAFGTNVGLGHTAFDPRIGFDPRVGVDPRVAWGFQNDPFNQARFGQTFPFVQWGQQSPFGWPNV